MSSGRRIVVTGAGAGIGAAVARLLAQRGADVWLTYASDAAGAADTATVCRGFGSDAQHSQLDLRDPASIERLTADVEQRWGELHALVNNAAVCPWTPWEDIAIAEWDAVLETNTRGPFLLTRALMPLLRRASGDRSIVNVSSVAGQTGGVATSIHYAASKGAVLAMTRSFARLLAAEGIRVNAVAPGPVRTAITDPLTDEARERLIGGVPLRRFGEPDEVAHVVVLLASPESGFTTGSTYDVNGGLLMD